MKDKCYIVQCSNGTYDYHHWIAGIFDNATDAEKLKQEIINENESARDTPAPFDESELKFLSDDNAEIYYKWLDKYDLAIEANTPTITEYDFNKRIV